MRHYKRLEIQKIFGLNLKPTANADKLLGIIKEIKGDYTIFNRSNGR